MSTVQFSKSLVDVFYRDFNNGLYPHQRLGQAFFNHFKLHKMNDNHLSNLYELDGDRARDMIASMTDYNH